MSKESKEEHRYKGRSSHTSDFDLPLFVVCLGKLDAFGFYALIKQLFLCKAMFESVVTNMDSWPQPPIHCEGQNYRLFISAFQACEGLCLIEFSITLIMATKTVSFTQSKYL